MKSKETKLPLEVIEAIGNYRLSNYSWGNLTYSLGIGIEDEDQNNGSVRFECEDEESAFNVKEFLVHSQDWIDEGELGSGTKRFVFLTNPES